MSSRERGTRKHGASVAGVGTGGAAPASTAAADGLSGVAEYSLPGAAYRCMYLIGWKTLETCGAEQPRS